MNTTKVYKYQTLAYLFIILFGVQNHFLKKFNFSFSFYENIVIVVFFISVVTVLTSVILLINQSINILNRKSIFKKEVVYLVTNVILYYVLTGTSLYLSTQIRL